jgi:membrane protein
MELKSRLYYAYEWIKTSVKLFLKSNCSVFAASLTYYSMLSIVPVLCILLMLAKVVGFDDYAREKIHWQCEQFISEFESAPETSITSRALDNEQNIAAKAETARSFANEARKIEKNLLESLDKIDFGTMGCIGFITLLWTALCSIGVAEFSFNEIWSSNNPRPIWKSYLTDLAVLVVLPLFIALAVSIPLLGFVKDIISMTLGATVVTKWLSDGVVWLLDSVVMRKMLTLAFSSLTFAFLFKTLPAVKVRFKYAWWCGVITAVMFGFWLKICTIAQVGIARSSLLYGSLALLPIILAWIFISWQIVLFGCCMVRVTHAGRYVDKKPSSSVVK